MSENRTSASKREIYSKLLDIASKYTDVENTDYLRAGLFGYVTESMAAAIRDSSYHKDMVYRESSLNTAIIPASVYNWAKTFNVQVQAASPAYADIDIKINLDALETYLDNYAKPFDDKSEEYKRYGSAVTELDSAVILDKKDQIIAGDYVFMLENSIIIYRQKNDSSTNSYRYYARYLNTDTFHTTDYQGYVADKGVHFLTTYISENELVVKARAYQYSVKEEEKEISTSSYLNKVMTFDFENQFAGVKLYYKTKDEEKEVSLQYSNIAKVSEDVAFYNLNDKNKLELIFKNGEGYFRPAANSTIRLYIFTTFGADVPDHFSGDALMLFSNNDLKSLPIVINFNPTNIIGGKNAPSLSKIKETIISELSTRNTITTKNDLNNYFNILTSFIEDINDGRVSFIKQRDDIIRRIYNAYLLLRDNTDERTGKEADAGYISSCVPTNTIDVLIGEKGKESTGELIDLSYSKFTDNNKDNLQTLIDGTPTGSYYLCPFVIKINRQLKKVQYLYNLISQETRLSYGPSDSPSAYSSYYAIPISAELNRGFNDYKAADNKYTLTLSFTTNFNASELSCNFDGNIDVKLGNSTIAIPSTMLNGKINSEAASDSDGTLYTTKINIPLYVGISVDSKEFTYVNNYISGINIGTSTISSEVSCAVNGTLAVNGDPVPINVVTDDKLRFYEELDTVMDSDIVSNGSKIIGLNGVPVVHSSFFDGDTNAGVKYDGFIRQLFTYISILKENLNRLETSTFFNIKFYNTYGPAYIYNTTKTNLSLTMKIALYKTYYNNETSSANLKKQIKSYIRRLVDQMNLSGNGIRVSTIISMLTSQETFGQYIDYVEFDGMDGDKQYIGKKDIAEDIGIAPEWINIDSDILRDNDPSVPQDTGIIFIEGSTM